MPINPPVALLADLQHQDFTLTDAAGNLVGATWSIAPAAGTIDAAHGRYTAPGIVTQPQDVTITATPVAGGAASTALVSLKPAAVAIIPSSVALRATERQQFVAQVIGDPANNAVHWVVAPTLGTMGAAGLYTAPDPITDDQTLTVTAISIGYPTKTATSTVRLLPAPLWGGGRPQGSASIS